MKDLASSSSQSGGEGQQAGGHAGLEHPAVSPLETVPSAGSGQARGQAVPPITARPLILSGRGAVAPITARPMLGGDPFRSTFEIVDADGLVLTVPLVGQNSVVAIAHMLDLFARGDGLCLLHLTETIGGRCVACMSGWARHLLSAALR